MRAETPQEGAKGLVRIWLWRTGADGEVIGTGGGGEDDGDVILLCCVPTLSYTTAVSVVVLPLSRHVSRSVDAELIDGG